MLDHSNKDNNYLFIKNYRRHDGKIIIEYANGSTTKVIDNERNLRIIEEQMTKQVLEALQSKDKLKYFHLVAGVSAFAALIAINMYAKNLSLPTEAMMLADVILPLSAISSLSEYFYSEKKTKELKKLRFFIENRDLLNSRIKDNNISAGLSRSKRKMIDSQSEVFDFSTIDEFSYNDLLTINDNIKREDALKFDYSLNKSINK